MLDRITFDQIRMLIAVAECGSFSAAARKLNRVQSAVSQSIQGLEDALQIRLFDRTRRVPELTDAGVAILKEAHKVIRNMDALRARANNIASVAEPEITLSIEQVFPNDILIQSLNSLKAAFPFVSVTVFAEGLGGPEQSLREENARLAIYSPVADGAPGIQMEYLGSIPVTIVASSDHPLAKSKGPIDQEELDEHVQLALTDRTKKYRGLVMGSRAWSFVEQNNRLDYVLEGFGWCCLPRHLVQDHVASGRLKELDLTIYGGRPLVFPLYAGYKTERPPGPATRWLLEDLRQRFSAWVADTMKDDSRETIQIRVTAA